MSEPVEAFSFKLLQWYTHTIENYLVMRKMMHVTCKDADKTQLHWVKESRPPLTTKFYSMHISIYIKLLDIQIFLIYLSKQSNIYKLWQRLFGRWAWVNFGKWCIMILQVHASQKLSKCLLATCAACDMPIIPQKKLWIIKEKGIRPEWL